MKDKFLEEILDEIHRVRAEHAAEFNHDLKAMLDDLRRHEALAKARGVKFLSPPKDRRRPCGKIIPQIEMETTMDSVTRKQRVYVETSVVSCLTARPSRNDVMQTATKLWWQKYQPQCEAIVSELVDLEIEEGDADAVRRRQESVAMLPRVRITDETSVLAKRLLQVHALPAVAQDDAMHVALAAVHTMDILLTWNCRHIANGRTMSKILDTITEAKYKPPMIMTPTFFLETMGESL